MSPLPLPDILLNMFIISSANLFSKLCDYSTNEGSFEEAQVEMKLSFAFLMELRTVGMLF